MGIAAAVTMTAALLAPSAALARKFVYVHDRQLGGGIWGFEMTKQGDLSTIPGSPFPLVDEPISGNCGGHCQTMAYSSKRKTLYAGGETGVSGWTVNKDGTLTLVPGSPFAPGAATSFLGTGVVQSGKRVFVYAASFDADGIFGWEADKDGSLAQLAASPFTAGDGPDGLATRKKLVFVANESAGSISSFVAEKDGTLIDAPGSPVAPAPLDFIYNVSPDPAGKRLYVADDAGVVHAFAVDKKTAGLTPLAGSPFATASGNAKTGAIVTKKLLWAAEFSNTDNALQPFAIGKDGSLEATGIVIDTPVAILTHTSDSKGKRIAIAGSDRVDIATIEDKRDGSLSGIGTGVLTDANSNAVVIVKR
jgi:6-phosphogluconolactonase (cycloisomerase 2 family)